MRRSKLFALIYLGVFAQLSLAVEPKEARPAGEQVEPEFDQFVDELAKTMNAREPSFYQEHLNLDELVARAVRSMPSNPGLSAGLLKGISEEGNLPVLIVRALGDKGSYFPLWVRTAQGRTRALMRMVSTEGALNYHELLLVKDAIGRVEVIDIYVFVSGELMSQTLRRGALNVLGGQNPSILSSLRKGDQNYLKHIDTISALHRATLNGNYQEVLDLYEKLPASVQADKSVSIARIQAARHLDEKLYLAALDDYAQQFPHDPSSDLMLIDVAFLRKDFEKCLASVESLNKRVGGDPYLNSFRANMALVQGKTDEARKYFEAAAAGAPGVVQPYFALVEISMIQKDFAETARLMTKLEEEMNIRFADDLSETPVFAEFCKSPEYEAWKEKRQKP
jgi:tetratricopeptide (TPR) repeat protein